jgi:Protein of unknown function (DUF2721)
VSVNSEYGYAVQAIQAILAPAIMVSACGLLLLGLLNRYTVIMSRIRVLNEERRRLVRTATPPAEAAATEVARLASVMRQLEDLVDRVRLLRNAVMCQVVSVGCFVLTSLLIGIRVAGPEWLAAAHPLAIFVIGMAVLFAGVVFEGTDVIRAYRTIRLELGELGGKGR